MSELIRIVNQLPVGSQRRVLDFALAELARIDAKREARRDKFINRSCDNDPPIYRGNSNDDR